MALVMVCCVSLSIDLAYCKPGKGNGQGQTKDKSNNGSNKDKKKDVSNNPINKQVSRNLAPESAKTSMPEDQSAQNTLSDIQKLLDKLTDAREQDNARNEVPNGRPIQKKVSKPSVSREVPEYPAF